MMQLSTSQIEALDEAETLMVCCDFCPYLDLKALLHDRSEKACRKFKQLFTGYYGLNVGGLTSDFKDRYFQILFDPPLVEPTATPDVASILEELSELPRRKGDKALPFSFVSKLANIHSDTSPIFDKHVLAFRSGKRPSRDLSKAERIGVFLDLLKTMATDYTAWAALPEVAGILRRLKERDRRLTDCSEIRLLDFLVWKAGKVATMNR
ncbi:MAG TPA: hypothetical protein VN634_14975 [Candidatus Limnocylindrales bacterium]|nr:hypothetical protein [Candidatus Limnocylindrales bacterium]